MQALYVSSTDASGTTREVGRYFVEGEDLEVTLPEGSLDLEAALVTPNLRARHQVTWSDVGATLTNVYVAYDTDELETGWEVILTPGWLAETSYTVPDLSDLGGWQPAWNATQAEITYTFIFLGAGFEPTEQALHSFLNLEDMREDEWSFISAVLQD